jgi:transposase
MKSAEILNKILLPTGSDWVVVSVDVDEHKGEILVSLEYSKSTISFENKEYPIYDYRKPRIWRHLDLWQYKTYLKASIPRYSIDNKVRSVEVPWSDVSERVTKLFEKKL